jgi:hypothetical protein
LVSTCINQIQFYERDMLGAQRGQLLGRADLPMRLMPVTKKNDAMGKNG